MSHTRSSPWPGSTCNQTCWYTSTDEANDAWKVFIDCLDLAGYFACTEEDITCMDEAWESCAEELTECVGCNPDCDGKECGPDGCGGSCGECPTGTGCAVEGSCDASTCMSGDFSSPVWKVNSLSFGKEGHPGEGLDLDDNPETCSPQGQCDGGVDNQFSLLVEGVSQFLDLDMELKNGLESGEVVLLLEAITFNNDGAPIVLNLRYGEPVLTKEECDWQSQQCAYHVVPTGGGGSQCPPSVSLDNGMVEGGVLTAGGFDYGGILVLPVLPEEWLYIDAHAVRLVGTMEDGPNGAPTVSGLLGFAIPFQQIKNKMCEFVEDLGLPVCCECPGLEGGFNLLPDIDSDGDGMVDVVSVGMKFTTIPAIIAGSGGE